jgi:hypothetical protein
MAYVEFTQAGRNITEKIEFSVKHVKNIAELERSM